MTDRSKAMEAIKSNGGRITSQRLIILDILENNTCHPTADDISAEIARRLGTVSTATVYNTLDILEHCGCLTRICTGNKAHYDPDTSLHGHLYCTECGTITDIPISELSRKAIAAEACGYSISSVTVNGICPECAQKLSAESS